MAEAVRFELTNGFRHRQFSRLVHSTALPRFLQLTVRAEHRKQQALYAKTNADFRASAALAHAGGHAGVVFQAAVGQGASRFQDGVGDRAQQRVDAFEVADQVDVQ